MVFRVFRVFLTSCLSFLLLSGGATGFTAETATAILRLPASSDHIRVRILSTQHPSRLSCPGTFHYGLLKNDRIRTSRSSLKVRASGSTLMIGTHRFKGDVLVMPDRPKDSLTVNGQRYRGVLLFHPLGRGRYDVVEYLQIAEYLFGVLPKEVHPSWPIEALKAQAVVSRSYAMANKRVRMRERFDVSSTVMDQVYGGQDVESSETNRAVLETEGRILVDPTGRPVRAFFHAACGGRTERPENVWNIDSQEAIYDVTLDHTYCAAYPRHQWDLTLSYSALRERLRRAGVRVQSIRSVDILQQSPSGRAQTVLLKTSKGEIHLAGNRFRLAVGPEALRSTLITELKADKKSVTFEGLGWGHGVGLCQWGARGRALEGHKYKEILKVYYPQAKVVAL